jgi:hypothetical protein
VADLFGNPPGEFNHCDSTLDILTTSIDTDCVRSHVVVTDDKNVWGLFHLGGTNALAELIVGFNNFYTYSGCGQCVGDRLGVFLMGFSDG